MADELAGARLAKSFLDFRNEIETLHRRVRQRRLRNDRHALTRYFAEFSAPHRAVVETTGRWYWLRELLVAQGIDLQLAHAKRLNAISTAKVKTDAINSDTLEQLCQAGLIPRAPMIRPEFRGARDLLRTRLRLVSKRTSCRNSLHRLLEKFNVPGVAQLSERYQLQAACHLEQSGLLLTQIHRLEQELHPEVLRRSDGQRLLWIPGIGKLGVSHVLRNQTDYDGTFNGKPLSRTKRSQWPRLASPDAELSRPPREVGSCA